MGRWRAILESRAPASLLRAVISSLTFTTLFWLLTPCRLLKVRVNPQTGASFYANSKVQVVKKRFFLLHALRTHFIQCDSHFAKPLT